MTKKYKKVPMNMFSDNDKNGVANIFDCSSNNKKKQDMGSFFRALGAKGMQAMRTFRPNIQSQQQKQTIQTSHVSQNDKWHKQTPRFPKSTGNPTAEAVITRQNISGPQRLQLHQINIPSRLPAKAINTVPNPKPNIQKVIPHSPVPKQPMFNQTIKYPGYEYGYRKLKGGRI